MWPAELKDEASRLLMELRAAALSVATAESCTGGMLAALLTETAGSSDVFERGFVTYSNEAKMECLGVDPELIDTHGAVSPEVARAMAEGALVHSNADIAISITGVAGPGGGSAEKPIGLVHFAAARTGTSPTIVTHRFGDPGRAEVRMASVRAGLALLRTVAFD